MKKTEQEKQRFTVTVRLTTLHNLVAYTTKKMPMSEYDESMTVVHGALFENKPLILDVSTGKIVIPPAIAQQAVIEVDFYND